MPLWAWILCALGLVAAALVFVAIRGYPEDGSF